MRTLFLTLLLLIQCFNIQAYVSNTIIPTPALQGTFDRPKAIEITPDGKYAYVANLGPIMTANGSVIVIDIATNTIIPTPALHYAFNNPQALAITPNGQYVYVAAASSGSVMVIRTSDNTILNTPALTGVFGYTSDIAITPDGAYALVLSDTNLVAISTTNNMISQTLSLGALSNPNAIAISMDGNYAYVGQLFATVQVVNLRTNPYQILNTPQFILAFGYIQLLAGTPNGKYFYVTNGSFNSVNVIDAINNTVLSTPNLASGFNNPYGVAITPDNKDAYVVNPGANSVSQINIATNTIIPTPGLTSGFDNPQEIAITPNGMFGYVTNVNDNSVTVFFIGVKSPTNFKACKQKNIFFTQSDYINLLTWSAPTSGNPPVAYNIYRDAALTQLIASVSASCPLQYYDANRNPCVTDNYYIISVDAGGNTSVPAMTTAVNCC
jgi:DNA-binding beta-propeller fold protein YncE